MPLKAAAMSAVLMAAAAPRQAAAAQRAWTMPDFEPQASSVDLMGDIVEAQSMSVAGISALEDDLADCVTDLGALQDDVSAAEGAISSLASGVSALQGDMSTAEGAVSELETSVSALQGGLSSAEGAISELQAAVSSLETDVADADAAISSLNSEVSILQTDVAAADAAISSLDSEVASLQTDVSAADAAISSLDSEVASLQTDVSAADAAISSLDSEVASLQTDVSAADAAISSLEGDVSTLQGAVSTAQADISSLESDALALQDDVSSINAVLEDLEALVATATGEGVPGTKTNPAPSCRYVLQVGGDKHNGLYWLDHDGNEEPYQAFCDMGRGGLELVHKLEGGIGGDANSIWTGTGVNADDIAHHSLFQTGGHFMSSKVQGMWDDAGTYLNAVHAGVYNGNRRVAHFSFKAAGSSYTSWFSKTYLVDSSYNDLLTKTGNFFGIVGDDTNGRNWFINEKYGGCDVDAGWMVIDSNGNDPCDWEAAYPANAILYNKGTTSAAATGYLDADTFAVLVDYDVVYASCLDALQQMNFRARDGQYWINHAGNTANQLVYCDMEHGGYELVFKIVHGGRVSPKWNSGSSSSQNPYVDALWTNAAYDVPLQLGRNVDVHDEEQSYGNGEHYTSPFRYGAFDDSDIFVEDIEVRMVTAEETVKFIQFAGFSQTDDTAWFSKSFLGANSWSDLTPSSQFNYFSIAGHAAAGRNWYINSYYGGCDVDSGWIAVVSRVSGCAWEEREYGTPDVMYACSADKFDYCSSAADTGDCATISTSNSFCYADLLAVFYKWREA